MLNEEIILQEMKKCYYGKGEVETAEKNDFLKNALVAKIRQLFNSDEEIFWCGHEKTVNIWAATPVKSPNSIKLWELFGPSDAKFVFLSDSKAVYINIMRMLEENNQTCYEEKAIEFILCGYYWTKKKDEICSRAVRIVAKDPHAVPVSVNISNGSYADLLEKIQKKSESDINKKIIILDDSDSIKKYHSTRARRKSGVLNEHR